MKWWCFVISGALLWLMLSWFASSVGLADVKTTNNLITNGNFETGNANSWTTSGNTSVVSDCCELNGVSSNYDLEFGNSGAIEQQFNLSTNTITQEILNNGITLNSIVEVQNGECAVSGCWGGQGLADTFTITLKIKDSSGNVLATTTNVRTNVTGINGANFQDTLIYTGQNSNLGNINIAAIDANAPANLGGPNVDNISVTMTYDDTVLSTIVQTELTEIQEELTEVVKLLLIETFEEEVIEIKTVPKELEIMAEEITTEIIEEVKESFQPLPMMTSMPEEEPELIEEATEIVEEIIKEESTETISNVKEEKQVEKESEVKTEEKESTSKNTTTSIVSSKKNIKQKKVQSKKTINAKLEKVMTKIDKEIKNSSKNLQLKNLIKMDVMIGEQLSLAVYENVEFYKPKVIYLNQLDIQDDRKIYSDITLAKYTDKDIIGIKQKELQLLDDKKKQLLNELEVLKNG